MKGIFRVLQIVSIFRQQYLQQNVHVLCRHEAQGHSAFQREQVLPERHACSSGVP